MAVQLATDAEFKALLENKKVVVKYFADWCGACKLFAPKYKRISNDEANQDIVFLEVNAEEQEEARKQAGVNNLPFMATFNNGELVEGRATSKEEALTEMIDALRKA